MTAAATTDTAPKTIVTGTVTFQSEWDGIEITRRFPTFSATTETPYVDLVDTAIELMAPRLPALPAGYSWLLTNEVISERDWVG